jgi:acyl-CoA oxidase
MVHTSPPQHPQVPPKYPLAYPPDKLFQMTLSQLMVGRLLYITGPVHALNLGLRIAIRYAFARRQFGPKAQTETCIMNYASHKQFLMPTLATTIALEFTRNQLMVMLGGMLPENKKFSVSRNSPYVFMVIDALRENREHYHSIVSGIKALVCEYCVDSLGRMRVMCGGIVYRGVTINDSR